MLGLRRLNFARGGTTLCKRVGLFSILIFLLTISSLHGRSASAWAAGLPLPVTEPIGPPAVVDTDGDGYLDSEETALGENANLYCPVMRADVDHDLTVTIGDLAQIASAFLQPIP